MRAPSAAPVSTSAASPARCTSTPPRWPRRRRLAHPLGVDLDLTAVHWTAMRDRIFGRIDAISDSGKAYREKSENVTLFTEPSRFVGDRTLRIGSGPTITADRFVLAAGSRPVIPDLPGLSEVTFHTSDTVMRLPQLPKSMIIMGGGYVAAEFGARVLRLRHRGHRGRSVGPDAAPRGSRRRRPLHRADGSTGRPSAGHHDRAGRARPRARAYAPTWPAVPDRRSR